MHTQTPSPSPSPSPLPLATTSSLRPHATSFCVLIILILHGVYASFYFFDARQYFRQAVVDSSILTYIYRLLGLGATVHRDIYWTLGVTDTLIAAWHTLALVRALQASLRFRRLLLDRPHAHTAGIAAHVKSKLQYLAHKTTTATVSTPAASRRYCSSFGRFLTVRRSLRRAVHWLKNIKRDYFTMDGVHFESGANIRESFEILTQINLLLRMSRTISEQQINDLVVSIFSLNCWSTPLLRLYFRHARDPFPGRVARQIVGMLLASCFTVAVPGAIWGYAMPQAGTQAVMFDQLLSTHVRNLVRHVLISIGTLKRKLTAVASKSTLHRHDVARVVAIADLVDTLQHQHDNQPDAYPPVDPPPMSPVSTSNSAMPRRQLRGWSHALDVVWAVVGVAVVALHILARGVATPSAGLKCEMPLQPWLATQLPCAVLEINCFRGSLSGTEQEMDRVLASVDESSLSTLRFTHCPALEMPHRLQTLSNLALLEVYNSTIVAWPSHAALTSRHHPYLGSVWLVRVRGIKSLPLGLQDVTFPTADVIISGSDLAGLPDDLATRWPHKMSKFVVEHSRLTEFPVALLMINAIATSLAGNNLTQIPEMAFQGRHWTYLSLAENPYLERLPYTGWTASTLDMRKTNLTTAPSWLRASSRFLAGGTPLCERIHASSEGIDCNLPRAGVHVTGLFPMEEISAQRLP